MNSAKRKALEAAGWKVGDAADFLGMNDEERQLLDARVELALAVRRQREASHLSQKALGVKLKTSQPRVAKIERAATDVSLDQLVPLRGGGGPYRGESRRGESEERQVGQTTAAKHLGCAGVRVEVSETRKSSR